MAADSEPQGVGNYGNVDVRDPAGGRWTAVVPGYPAGSGGYTARSPGRRRRRTTPVRSLLGPRRCRWRPARPRASSLSVKAPADARRPGRLGPAPRRPDAPVTSVPVVVRILGRRRRGRPASPACLHRRQRPRRPRRRRLLPVHHPVRHQGGQAELALHSNPSPGNPVGAYLVSPDGDVRLRAELRPVGRAARHHRPDAHRDRARPGRGYLDADPGVRRARLRGRGAPTRTPGLSPSPKPGRSSRLLAARESGPCAREGGRHPGHSSPTCPTRRRTTSWTRGWTPPAPSPWLRLSSARPRCSPPGRPRSQLPARRGRCLAVLFRAQRHLVGRGAADLDAAGDDRPGDPRWRDPDVGVAGLSAGSLCGRRCRRSTPRPRER